MMSWSELNKSVHPPLLTFKDVKGPARTGLSTLSFTRVAKIADEDRKVAGY